MITANPSVLTPRLQELCRSAIFGKTAGAMQPALSPEQIDQFHTDGWISPIDVFSPDEAAELLAQFEAAEAVWPGQLADQNRNNAHLTFPFLAEIATDPRVVTRAQALVGADMVLWSSVLFVKEPASSAFVSWHQDATYMALEPPNFVTAWIALTSSTLENGCVSVLPGTHRDGRRSHEDTFGEDNILTRGQQVEDVDDTTAVHLTLEPGQMSLHHPWLVHGSQPNRSTIRRVGFALQSYLGADVAPTRGEHHVMHIAGAPVPDHWIEAPHPTSTCDATGQAARTAANAAFADVLYDGAERRRDL